MLDQEKLTNIRDSGIPQGAAKVEERDRILQQELEFRMVDTAGYALIASCYLPFRVPQDMKAFRNLLHYFRLDYTLLPKEYCCGDPFFVQAIRNKNEEEMDEAQPLAREFLDENLRQVREAGVSKIVTFCEGCDQIYSRFRGSIEQEVLWYPTLLDSFFAEGKLEMEADYYAGCYYTYKRVSPTSPDLDSILSLLSRIEGLRLNHIDNHLCCFRSKHSEALTGSIRNRTVITPCAGCAIRLREALKDKSDHRVVMLPQVVWAAVDSHTL